MGTACIPGVPCGDHGCHDVKAAREEGRSLERAELMFGSDSKEPFGPYTETCEACCDGLDECEGYDVPHSCHTVRAAYAAGVVQGIARGRAQRGAEKKEER